MSSIMQKQQLRMSRVAFSSQRRIKPVGRTSNLIVRANLFSFLNKPAPTNNSARTNELVDELFAITRNTDAGATLSQQKQEQVKELVKELSQYCPRNPLRNKLLFGKYEVLFAFKKDATGGTLRSGAGPILFPGQKPYQTLEEPNIIINRLDFKALGFLPGYGQQVGTFTPLNADTFELKLTQRQVNTGIGGQQVADIDFVRKIQILYLDERCRVARFIPDATEEETQPQDDLYFVFERVVEEQGSEPVEEEAPAKGTTMVSMFGSRGKQPGLATIAERKVREQLEADAQSGKAVPVGRGTSMVRAGTSMVRVGTGIVKAKPGTGVVKAKPAAAGKASAKGVDPRAAAAEKRRAEAEAVKARAKETADKAKREEAARLAKEKAEAERQAKQQKIAAVKEALNKLAGEIQEAQVASRQAKVELRDVEKETQATNRKTAEARAQLEASISRTQSASNELQAAIEARNNAQAEAKQAQAAFKETEKNFREQLAAAGKR